MVVYSQPFVKVWKGGIPPAKSCTLDLLEEFCQNLVLSSFPRVSN